MFNWKCLGILSLIFCLMLSIGRAQDKYKGGTAPDSHDLKYKTDLEFAKLLKKDWMKADMLPGLVADSKPKPITVPVAEVPESQMTSLEETFERSRPVEEIEFVEPAPPPESPPIVKRPLPIKPLNMRKLEFTFFGTPVKINYDPTLVAYVGNRIDNQSISSFWDTVSRADYGKFLEEADYYRVKMNLNDWGYGIFLHQAAKAIYPESANGATLLTWYLLVKSGFDARVGYNGDRVFLLLPSSYVWYETPRFTVGSNTYYVAPFSENIGHIGSLYVYENAYPGAEKPIDVKIIRTPTTIRVPVERVFKFEYRGQDYTVVAKYNKPVVEFFDAYPQTDLAVYFSASLSPEAGYSLLNALEPIIKDRSEAEAVNILLRFVQTAFSYKTDADQFGREKFLFPEETLFYPYCDCEDRAVLFAFLVRSLTGLEVIGLDYPGHVATAVKFNDPIPGDFVLFKAQRYTICDPTYVNAEIGMCQPRYRDITPEIVKTGI